MKALLLTFSFLLLAFTINAELVLDTNGVPLFSGHHYYIYPVIWGPTGGGLRPGKAGNSTYEVAVLKSFSEVDFGKPLIFLPLVRIGIIPTDIKLSIGFAHTPCHVESGNWIAVKDLGEIWSLAIGGAEDHEGYETLNGFFKISKAKLGYKLSFLPNLNNTLPADIGTYIDYKGRWRLILENGEPYEVVFIKSFFEST